MNFVFDENSDKKLKELMTACFKRIKEDLSNAGDEAFGQLGELTFASSEIECPLQAADLLAFQAHRHAREANGDPHHSASQEFGRALSRMKSKEDFWFFDSVRFHHLESLYRYAIEEAKTETPAIEEFRKP